MRRPICVALATAFFALSAPADSSAQASVFVGGGVTIPTQDFKDLDGANTGWQGMAGAQFAIGESGFTAGPRVYYGSNNHETTGDKTNLFGGTALANFNFGEGEEVNPFVWGEVGIMSHAYKSDSFPASEETTTAAVVAGGAGVGFPLGGVNGWAAAGYTKGLGDNKNTTYIGIYAGVSFAVGGM